MVSRILIIAMACVMLNGSQVMANKQTIKEKNIIRYDFAYIEQNGKSRMMFPDEYWFYLENYVNKQIKGAKELEDSKRIFKTKDWKYFKQEIRALTLATITVLPEKVSKILKQDMELIEHYSDEIQRVNLFANTKEAKIWMIQEMCQIIDTCQDMMLRVSCIDEGPAWDEWWKQIYETADTAQAFFKKIVAMTL